MVVCILDRTILIISGGFEAIEGIKVAKSMGLNVVVLDGNRNAPGFEYADFKIIASTYDVEDACSKVLHFNLKIKKIDGVLSIASDVPVTVSTISNLLNLNGIPLKAAHISIDKELMKSFFLKNDILTPEFTKLRNYDHFKESMKILGYPAVLKPVTGRGSRGVIRITRDINLKWAWNHAMNNSSTKSLMIEKYLIGNQISTETIITNGKAYTIGMSDRNYEYLEKYNPYFIENGGDLPSKYRKEYLEKANTAIQAIANIFDIKNGVIKGDLVVHNNMLYIIEVAFRLSGGFFSSHHIPYSTGVNFIKCAIKIALNEKISTSEIKVKQNNFICQRFLMKKKGLLSQLSLKNAKKSKGVKFIASRYRKGSQLENPVNSGGWLVVVVTNGDSRKDAELNARNALEKVSYSIVEQNT